MRSETGNQESVEASKPGTSAECKGNIERVKKILMAQTLNPFNQIAYTIAPRTEGALK